MGRSQLRRRGVAVIDEVTVGERVAFCRRRRGITQEVLAGLLGRTVEWLAQFERGAKELDRLSTLVAVAHALGIEPVKLLPAAFFTHRRELNKTVFGRRPGLRAPHEDVAEPVAQLGFASSSCRPDGVRHRGPVTQEPAVGDDASSRSRASTARESTPSRAHAAESRQSSARRRNT